MSGKLYRNVCRHALNPEHGGPLAPGDTVRFGKSVAAHDQAMIDDGKLVEIAPKKADIKKGSGEGA